MSYGATGFYVTIIPGIVWQWDEVLFLFPIGVPVLAGDDGEPLYLVNPEEADNFSPDDLAVYPLDISRLDYEQKRSLMAVFSGFYGVPIQNPRQLRWIQITMDLVDGVFYRE